MFVWITVAEEMADHGLVCLGDKAGLARLSVS